MLDRRRQYVRSKKTIYKYVLKKQFILKMNCFFLAGEEGFELLVARKPEYNPVQLPTFISFWGDNMYHLMKFNVIALCAFKGKNKGK